MKLSMKFYISFLVITIVKGFVPPHLVPEISSELKSHFPLQDNKKVVDEVDLIMNHYHYAVREEMIGDLVQRKDEQCVLLLQEKDKQFMKLISKKDEKEADIQNQVIMNLTLQNHENDRYRARAIVAMGASPFYTANVIADFIMHKTEQCEILLREKDKHYTQRMRLISEQHEKEAGLQNQVMKLTLKNKMISSIFTARVMIDRIEELFSSGANRTEAKALGIRYRELKWRHILFNCTDDVRVKAMVDAIKAQKTPPRTEIAFAACVADISKLISQEINIQINQSTEIKPVTLSVEKDPRVAPIIKIIKKAFQNGSTLFDDYD